ncbi:hypothetical protein F5B18DRAFT_80123 [Nemania serpens]|nr:hypothetical protein F5B18DRAFT_80123 [Nemania serpens]
MVFGFSVGSLRSEMRRLPHRIPLSILCQSEARISSNMGPSTITTPHSMSASGCIESILTEVDISSSECLMLDLYSLAPNRRCGSIYTGRRLSTSSTSTKIIVATAPSSHHHVIASVPRHQRDPVHNTRMNKCLPRPQHTVLAPVVSRLATNVPAADKLPVTTTLLRLDEVSCSAQNVFENIHNTINQPQSIFGHTQSPGPEHTHLLGVRPALLAGQACQVST